MLVQLLRLAGRGAGTGSRGLPLPLFCWPCRLGWPRALGQHFLRRPLQHLLARLGIRQGILPEAGRLLAVLRCLRLQQVGPLWCVVVGGSVG